MVQPRSRDKDHLKFCNLYSIDKMACQLQPECNFLHGFFKCKLPIEVVDVEVKIMSMQGTHLYKRDRTMQVTKFVPWTNNIRPHPNIIKKVKTFLEVEKKMGPSIPTSMPNSQFRPLLPETNPNISRTDKVEKRKTIMPKRKFRPVTPKVTVTNPPLPQAPLKPSNKVPPTVRADTPWPGAGKMSGNLFDDRQWLLPKGYLATQNKKENIEIPSLKEEPKVADNPKENKCGWDPIVPSARCRKSKEKIHSKGPYQTHKVRNQT